MNKAVLFAAALALAPLAASSQQVPDTKDREPSYVGKSGERAAPSERTDDRSQTSVRDRVALAIETIEDACAADVDDFCGKVTSGGGRVSLCMLAHEDRLSGGCRVGVVSRFARAQAQRRPCCRGVLERDSDALRRRGEDRTMPGAKERLALRLVPDHRWRLKTEGTWVSGGLAGLQFR